MSRPVALLSMPTLSAHVASYQLALLAPTLRRAGIAVEPYSLFIDFGARIGWQANRALGLVYGSMAGEWIWAKAAFGDFASEREYLETFESDLDAACRLGGLDVKALLAIRSKVTFDFLDEVIESVDWAKYSMVGFSVVFQQMLASLALARRLKERYPRLPIVFGGATFEDDIASEVMARCDFVDAVHRGDADVTFPQLVRRLEEGRSLEGVPGLMWRDGSEVKVSPRAPNLTDLSQTPAPDFDEYYATLARTGYLDSEPAPELPIETARGCWYGMKNHCTFCGLNRSGMDFRARPAAQVMELLKELSRRYGVLRFNAIDNIMAPDYPAELFGALAAGKSDLKLHYEIRPTVQHAQLKAMWQGGLFSVQPGIESFSTHVLSLMRKHTTGMKNLELVKWTTYYDVDNLYNVLHGFNGETAEDYAAQAKLFRLIPHFQPPYAIAHARADRGSPMFEEPAKNGLRSLTPGAAYRFLFPPEFELSRISYYFDDERDGLPPEAFDECHELVAEWQQRWRSGARPSMDYVKSWGTLTIHDARRQPAEQIRLDDRMAELYEACLDARRREDLLAHFQGDAAWLDGALEELVQAELLAHLDDRYLALALPRHGGH